MNNQSPLIPQGSTWEQKNRGRARMKIAVFFVLAVHGVGLMALLMQGCGHSKEPAQSSETTATNQTPAFVEQTNVAPATSAPPVAVTAPPTAVTPPPETNPPAPGAATEYTIAKGDMLKDLAPKFHVTIKAILEANPGLEPTKLKIGQKIKIPAPTAPTGGGAAAATPSETASAGGEEMYTVKSGDYLLKIAQQHGVSVKALKAANALKTDSIKVGQKLKIPAKAAAAAPAAPAAPTEPAPTSATPSSPTTPAGR